MDDLMRSAFEQYSKVLPQDLRDTEVFMSTDTIEELKRTLLPGKPPAEWSGVNQMFGLPVRADDALPYRVVELRTENAQERAIRRAAKDGITVNVMEPGPLWFPPAPPAPTVRALVKHWWKKVRRDG
jgi:hypothetical protein